MKVSMKARRLLPYLTLILIVFLGLFLRLRHWPDYLTFDFEKARDLIASMSVYSNKKLTLIGPVSEVEGIFHGPLYYYLVGLCYFLFKGDPRAGSIISFFFNLSSIPILFLIGKKLFNTKVGLVSAFVYAVSFEAISYAYWLSNPGPSVPFLFLMFYFFYQFGTKKETYLVPALFCLGIAVQFQILNIIFISSLIALYFVFGRPKISLKHLFLSLSAFFLPLSSFILFDIRHNFLMLNAFINNYFISKGGKFLFSFNLFDYIERYVTEFNYILLPSYKLISLPVLILLILVLGVNIVREKKNPVWKFLAVWIFSTIPIFLIHSRMSQSSAAFIGVSGGLIIMFSYLIDKLSANKKGFILALVLVPILFSNLFAIDHFLTDPSKRLFDFFQGLFYKTDIAVVESIYFKSENTNFKVDTVTSPLLVSPLWDYLLNWYSQKNKLPAPKRGDEQIQFLIIEPYVDQFYKDQAIKKKNSAAKMVDSEYFGNVAVQKWILK